MEGIIPPQNAVILRVVIRVIGLQLPTLVLFIIIKGGACIRGVVVAVVPRGATVQVVRGLIAEFIPICRGFLIEAEEIALLVT